MSDKKAIEEHESYGMVGLSRFTCGGGRGMNLFGSSIMHASGMTLTIRRGEKRRDLHREWYYGGDIIAEITLSPAQFAEMITTPNVGSGVPCTLNYIIGEGSKAECPEHKQRQLFEQEFEDDVRKAMADASQIVKDVTTLLEGKEAIKLSDRKAIIGKLTMLAQHINSNMPFVQAQFNEAMDKTVTEAKAEVEEFINAKIHSLGIDALTSEIAKAIQAPANSAPLQIAATEEK